MSRNLRTSTTDPIQIPTLSAASGRIGISFCPGTLCNGDEVMIRRVRNQEGLREGLYAIRGSSEIFVRRIAIDPMKNRLTVLTDHPAYPSWPGIQRKGVDIVGRVIWIGALVP